MTRPTANFETENDRTQGAGSLDEFDNKPVPVTDVVVENGLLTREDGGTE